MLVEKGALVHLFSRADCERKSFIELAGDAQVGGEVDEDRLALRLATRQILAMLKGAQPRPADSKVSAVRDRRSASVSLIKHEGADKKKGRIGPHPTGARAARSTARLRTAMPRRQSAPARPMRLLLRQTHPPWCQDERQPHGNAVDRKGVPRRSIQIPGLGRKRRRPGLKAIVRSGGASPIRPLQKLPRRFGTRAGIAARLPGGKPDIGE